MRRTQLQLSQELLAEKAGMSQSYYSEVERGARPLPTLTHQKLMALADALEWSLADMQEQTGIDLGAPRAERLATAEPTPVYTLQQLAHPNAKPEGLNLTPNQGKHPANWRQTVMEGDEMEPRIRDGESIYFDTDKTTPEKGVYVIVHQGRVHVRRYSQLPTGPAWTADNPAYALNFIPATNDVQVLGRVYRVVGIRDDKSLLN